MEPRPDRCISALLLHEGLTEKVDDHPQSLLAGDQEKLPTTGITPNRDQARTLHTNPRLLCTEEARPPLSLSPQAARPPEERKRGAGDAEATLKAREERDGRGENESPGTPVVKPL